MPDVGMSDAELLQRFLPYLQYDSLESFRSDSAAILPEYFFDDGSMQGYTNTLKRAGGSIVAAAQPQQGQKQLDLAFLGKRYSGGGAAAATDYLDAAGRRYVEDARRLHADARYADRAYGYVVREANGPTWLQYWFFYYYNDKNFLGAGLHEGDWEMIQLRMGRGGVPNAATFAQHRDGEAFNWSDLELRESPDGRRRSSTWAGARMPRFRARVSTGPCGRSRTPTTRMGRDRASARLSKSSLTGSRPGWSGPASGDRATRAPPDRLIRGNGGIRRRFTSSAEGLRAVASRRLARPRSCRCRRRPTSASSVSKTRP